MRRTARGTHKVMDVQLALPFTLDHLANIGRVRTLSSSCLEIELRPGTPKDQLVDFITHVFVGKERELDSEDTVQWRCIANGKHIHAGCARADSATMRSLHSDAPAKVFLVRPLRGGGGAAGKPKEAISSEEKVRLEQEAANARRELDAERAARAKDRDEAAQARRSAMEAALRYQQAAEDFEAKAGAAQQELQQIKATAPSKKEDTCVTAAEEVDSGDKERIQSLVSEVSDLKMRLATERAAYEEGKERDESRVRGAEDEARRAKEEIAKLQAMKSGASAGDGDDAESEDAERVRVLQNEVAALSSELQSERRQREAQKQQDEARVQEAEEESRRVRDEADELREGMKAAETRIADLEAHLRAAMEQKSAAEAAAQAAESARRDAEAKVLASKRREEEAKAARAAEEVQAERQRKEEMMKAEEEERRRKELEEEESREKAAAATRREEEATREREKEQEGHGERQISRGTPKDLEIAEMTRVEDDGRDAAPPEEAAAAPVLDTSGLRVGWDDVVYGEEAAHDVRSVGEADEASVHAAGALWMKLGWTVPRRDRVEWQQKLQTVTRAIPRTRDQARTMAVLEGTATAAQIRERPRVVRYLISSTFTDTHWERSLLIADVNPYILEYARARQVEVLPVEMRWGIRKEASESHQTSAICMQELRRCQQESAALSYLLIAGQKYGFRPFPSEIPCAEFDSLLASAADADGKALLLEWFKRDENAIDGSEEGATYVLQSSEGVDGWWDKFEKMQTTLREAARALWGATGAEQLRKPESQHRSKLYTWSVTEEEISKGLLWVDAQSRERQCAVFKRVFEGLEGFAEGLSAADRARDYIDIKNGKVDREALELMSGEQDMIASVPGNHVRVRYPPLQWGPGVNPQQPEHRRYLRAFADGVCQLLVDCVDRVDRELSEEPDPVADEAARHLRFAAVRDGKFKNTTSTQVVFQAVVSYFEASDNKEKPLVVYGKSGAGKTYLMAKAIAMAAELTKRRNGVLIARFLGTSPDSTNLEALLGSLLQQLRRAYGLPAATLPSSIRELTTAFTSDALALPSVDRPLILVLDSLDQLHPQHAARRLEWLVPLLAALPHIHLLLSTLPDQPGEFNCLSILNRRLSSNRLMEIAVISDPTGVLLHLLANNRRKLTAAQIDAVSVAFEKRKDDDAGTPLWLTVVAQSLSSLRSYDAAVEPDASVRGVINNLFSALESFHGAFFSRAALSYISLSVQGIGEGELVQMLSLNDDVLADTYEWWVPSIRVLPPLLVPRLLADLAPYLSRRGDPSSGVGLVAWYHRQFWEAAEARYGGDASERSRRHAEMSQFFSGEWHNVAKPYSGWLRERVGKKFPGEEEGDRQVVSQQLVVSGSLWCEPGRDINGRRVEELVTHLVRGGRIAEAAAELCSLEYIAAKFLKGGGHALVHEVISALKAAGATEGAPAREPSDAPAPARAPSNTQAAGPGRGAGRGQAGRTRSSERGTKATGAVVKKGVGGKGAAEKEPQRVGGDGGGEAGDEDGPGGGGQWAEEREQLEAVRSFIGRRLDRLMQLPANAPSVCVLQLALQEPSSSAVYRAGKALAASQKALLARLVMLPNKPEEEDRALLSMREHTAGVKSVAWSPDGQRVASVSTDKTVKLYDAESGEVLGTAYGHTDLIFAVAFSPNGKWLCTAGQDHCVRVWDADSLEPVEGQGCSRTGIIDDMAFSGDGKYLYAGGMSKILHAFDTETWSACAEPLSHDGRVSGVAASTQGLHLVTGSMDQQIRFVELVADKSGDYPRKLQMKGKPIQAHKPCVWAVAYSPCGKFVASGGRDFAVRLWDVATQKELAAFRGHGNEVNEVCFSPDSRFVASGAYDHDIRVWSVASKSVHAVIKGHEGSVEGVEFSPDGGKLLSGSQDATIRICYVPPRQFDSRQQPLPRRVSTCSDDGVEIDAAWSEGAAAWQAHGHGVRMVQLVDDGARLVTAGSAWDQSLKAWCRGAQGWAKTTFGGNNVKFDCKLLESAAINRSASLGALGGSNGEVMVFDLQKGKQLLREGVKVHENRCCSLQFGSDCSSPLLVSGGWDKTVAVWRLCGEELQPQGEKVSLPVDKNQYNYPTALHIAPDERRFAAGTADGMVRIFDTESRERVGPELDAHGKACDAVEFTREGGGEVLWSGGGDRTVRLWDLRAGSASVRQLNGHSAAVNVVRQGPGWLVLSGGGDSTVRLWDARGATAEPVACLYGSDYVKQLDWHASMVAVGLASGTVMMLRIDALQSSS